MWQPSSHSPRGPPSTGRPLTRLEVVHLHAERRQAVHEVNPPGQSLQGFRWITAKAAGTSNANFSAGTIPQSFSLRRKLCASATNGLKCRSHRPKATCSAGHVACYLVQAMVRFCNTALQRHHGNLWEQWGSSRHPLLVFLATSSGSSGLGSCAQPCRARRPGTRRCRICLPGKATLMGTQVPPIGSPPGLSPGPTRLRPPC